MTYFFETYGCQMNIAESAAVEQLFLARGWQKADDVQKADIVVINTCSVRATAEQRIFGRLGFFSGLKAVRAKTPGAKNKSLEVAAEFVKDGAKPLTLVVMGCMAERLLHSLKKDWPCVDYVVGTFAKKNFGKIISAVEEASMERRDISSNGVPIDSAFELDDSSKYEFAAVSLEQGAFSSFVPIMHGCNNFCTYCIVPYVRGREISRDVNSILKELDVLSKYGVKEITLLGQNVNSYFCENSDFGKIDFPALLKIISRHLEKTNSPIKWIRFESSHPKDFSDELIEVIASEARVCKFIHLPVQHGSTKILQKMNRRYSRENYLELVKKIRARIPDVALTTDIMLGFPGESEEDFSEAISLMREVRYDNAFMYYYNPREGTPAAEWEGQIPLEEKKSRLQKIIDLQLEITSQKLRERVGQIVTVLAEKQSRDNPNEILGKTERDERVAFSAPKNLLGNFAKVKLLELNGNTFKGELVNFAKAQ